MINNVTLVGKLTRDPELSFLPGAGTAKTTFTLAVTKNFKNKEGKYDANFIPCVVFGKPAENIVNLTAKGKLLAVVGEIATRNYEKDGRKVYVTEVNVSSYQILEWLDKPQSSNDGITPVEDDYNSEVPF